jgi:hypothetical protein
VANPSKEDDALFHCRLIAPLLDPDLQRGDQAEQLQALAMQEHPHPQRGRVRRSVSTLKRYLCRYRNAGPGSKVQALQRKERTDKGKQRSLRPEVQEDLHLCNRLFAFSEEETFYHATNNAVRLMKRSESSMKPWLAISNTRVIGFPERVITALDAYEKDIEVTAIYASKKWNANGGLERLDTYILSTEALLVGLVEQRPDQSMTFALTSYPLQHVAKVDRNFLVNVNQSTFGYLATSLSALTLHFTAASGIDSLTIPEPYERADRGEFIEFCRSLCQRVG